LISPFFDTDSVYTTPGKKGPGHFISPLFYPATNGSMREKEGFYSCVHFSSGRQHTKNPATIFPKRMAKNKRFETARFSLFILPAAGMGSPDIGKSGVKNPEKFLYREFRLV